MVIKLSKTCQILDLLCFPRKTFSQEVQKILGNSSNIRCFTLILSRNDRKLEVYFDLCVSAWGLHSRETDTWVEEKPMVVSQSSISTRAKCILANNAQERSKVPAWVLCPTSQLVLYPVCRPDKRGRVATTGLHRAPCACVYTKGSSIEAR